MPLLTLKNIYYSVGQFPLLDHTNFDIQEKERIALIGRNGEGKSTLMKILNGDIAQEAGEILKPSYLKIARLEQEVSLSKDMTVYEAIALGLQDLSELLIRYHHLLLSDNHNDAWMNQLHEIQEKIEQLDGWQLQQRIERIIQELDLPSESMLSALSGGWRRRVALGQALVQEPDILLLDEPTNHLDLKAIEWLEKMLLNYPKTILFITHDRQLLRKLATRIVELDRGKLTTYPADYDTYLERKAAFLVEEERANALFDKKLSEEEAWIRQGVKARRTRNEGRVRALKALREVRTQRRVLKNKPTFELNEMLKAGKTVIQAEDISFEYQAGKKLISHFSFNIQRGDKIAIVGPNGTGKTTLVKLLTGQLQPTSGSIKQSPTNKLAFFDQTRAQIKGEETLMANVAQGDDYVEIAGKKKHVVGYLGDFLFSPQKCRGLAKTLSGGEQNRLLLAKIFSKPANLLVLDEPTNDLDIESLDVLEDLLLSFEGTVIVISHDREFIDNIATHCILFDDKGNISVNVGGYSDWLAREKELEPIDKSAIKSAKTPYKPEPTKTNKLKYHEQQELKVLPAKIEALEIEIKKLQDLTCQTDFYTRSKEAIFEVNTKLSQLQQELSEHYKKWEDLDSRS